jgi:hypothetical protein|tara:strand:- start:703 stop:939 length:237 start_codon:yes stop_codon:yes gene_type:complete
MSRKQDITPSILKLRQLREKLCSSQENWKEAFEVRDFVICELTSLSEMLADSAVSKETCFEKSKEILNKFLVHEDRVK